MPAFVSRPSERSGLSTVDLDLVKDRNADLFWSVEQAPSCKNLVGLNCCPNSIFFPTGLVLTESANLANVPEVGHSRLIDVAMQLGT
jgi:hypothetical protein